MQKAKRTTKENLSADLIFPNVPKKIRFDFSSATPLFS